MHEEPGNLSPDPLASHVGSMPVNTVRARAFACTNVCRSKPWHRDGLFRKELKDKRVQGFSRLRAGTVTDFADLAARIYSIGSFAIEISHARFSLRFESSRLVFNEG